MHIHYYIYKASRVLLPIVIIGMAAVMETACTKRVRPTYITVADSIRHYYPVVSGEVLDLTYVVRNEGDDPFLIDDIQPSCGCIDAPKDIDAIPPHDSITLKFSLAAWLYSPLMSTWCRLPLTNPTTRKFIRSVVPTMSRNL